MKIIQTNAFKKFYKKLHKNQLDAVNQAINALSENHELGERKLGDLAWLRVYKFKVQNHIMLLGYFFEHETMVLTLVALGVHENFYRDIKN